MAELKKCVASDRTISIKADITCGGVVGEQCSCPESNNGYTPPLLGIINIHNLIIEGNGKQIKRLSNRKMCTLLGIAGGSSDIRVQNLILDEGSPTPPNGDSLACLESELGAKCQPSVLVHTASNIEFNNLRIENSKGYAVDVYGTNKFVFKNSKIINAGVLGLAIGGEYLENGVIKGVPTTDVQVTGSSFFDIGTNGIALTGVKSSKVQNENSENRNLITGNVFLGNHRFGAWKDENKEIYPGGQICISSAENLLISNNIIGDGFCKNYSRNAVVGIELTDIIREFSLKGIEISNNKIYNQHEHAVFINTYKTTTRSITKDMLIIRKNIFVNNGTGGFNANLIGLTTEELNSNTVAPTKQFTSFENGEAPANSWPVGWNTWNGCAGDSSIVRWQPGNTETLSGSSALRMMTKTLSCNDGAQGMWTQGFFNRIAQPGVTKFALNYWIRNGGFSGESCLVFVNTAYVEVSRTCAKHSLRNEWRYFGSSPIESLSPVNAVYVVAKFGVTTPNSYVDLDNIRLAWW